jgi:hypothetical protein
MNQKIKLLDMNAITSPEEEKEADLQLGFKDLENLLEFIDFCRKNGWKIYEDPEMVRQERTYPGMNSSDIILTGKTIGKCPSCKAPLHLMKPNKYWLSAAMCLKCDSVPQGISISFKEQYPNHIPGDEPIVKVKEGEWKISIL